MTLAALHEWLLARSRELSFSPEIGDATIGGLVTTMCKDSSVNGPGHLCALVEAITYVDHEGNVRLACVQSLMHELMQSVLFLSIWQEMSSSLVTTMCKESNVIGPGHVCALVEAIIGQHAPAWHAESQTCLSGLLQQQRQRQCMFKVGGPCCASCKACKEHAEAPVGCGAASCAAALTGRRGITSHTATACRAAYGVHAVVLTDQTTHRTSRGSEC